jgi:hypothetical protein
MLDEHGYTRGPAAVAQPLLLYQPARRLLVNTSAHKQLKTHA